jgi:hypothetical protein
MDQEDVQDLAGGEGGNAGRLRLGPQKRLQILVDAGIEIAGFVSVQRAVEAEH